jgi:hypothetical protein
MLSKDYFRCEVCEQEKPYKTETGYWSLYHDVFIVCSDCFTYRQEEMIKKELEFSKKGVKDEKNNN